SPDGRCIAFAHDPATEKRLDNCKALAAVDVKTRRVATLAQDAEWDFDAPCWSPDGRRLAFLAARSGVRHTSPTIAALLEPGRARWRFGAIEGVRYAGANGKPVQMWRVKPPGFDPKKKHPVLHIIHGGPHAAQGDTFHYRWNLQVFAARGYVVAGVNYHGSSG